MTAATSSNGWPVIQSFSSRMLRDWQIGPVSLLLRTGPAGFVLAHHALWFHEEIEPLQLTAMPDFDDHGYGQRFIGSTTIPSNHWSATAIDLNAKLHPQHTPTLDTFTAGEAKRIRTRVRDKYKGVIVWGGDWSPRNVDSMHFEFADRSDVATAEAVRLLAKELVPTPLGKRLLAAQDQPVHTENW